MKLFKVVFGHDMALLQDCFFCSLSVAASVIGVYTLVAYIIAFFMETWWIVSTPVSLPSPAYVLCAGYLIVSIFSGILLRGLSIKNTLFLLEWLLVVAALSVPEGLLVYFMSIHYWNIRSLYGLMELTCWICRAIVNLSGMICVQSLYSTWREEKEVLRRLRDLNMTRVIPNRRNSVSSQVNGYAKSSAGSPSVYMPPPQLLNNGAFVPTLRRLNGDMRNVGTPGSPDQPPSHKDDQSWRGARNKTASMVSVMSRPQSPAMFMAPQGPPFMMNPAMSLTFKTSEFNASQFDLTLMSSLQGTGGPQINKSYSLMDLRSTSSVSDLPRKTMSVIDFPVEKKEPKHTQSLDRRILKSSMHWNSTPPIVNGYYTTGRLKNAYFPPFRNGEFPVDPAIEFVPQRELIYGTNINSFYPGKRSSQSKHSLGSDSDDFQKYRDIAL